MVNEYDLFVVIAKRGSITTKELQHLFTDRFKTPQHLYHHLNKLKKNKLVTQHKGITEVINSKRGKELYRLLHYCVTNELNYTFYFSKKTLSFLERTYTRTFNATTIKITPQQFKELVDQLEQDTFLIRYKKKPFFGRVLKHSFLRELLRHHRRKIPKALGCPNNVLNNIIRSRRKSLKTLIPLNKIGFIHTSLALEGNLLTLRETERLLKKHVVPEAALKQSQEVLQYEKGLTYIDQFIASRKRLGVAILFVLHKKVMLQENYAGKIRKENVTIKGNSHFKTAPHEKIPSLLDKFINEWNGFKEKNIISIIEEAARLHNSFQYIHPFIDGNSRTTRLLMYAFFRIHGIAFHDIPLGFTTEYLAATKGAKKRDDNKLARTLKELLIQTIKK